MDEGYEEICFVNRVNQFEMEGGYDVECLSEVSKDLFCMTCLKLMKNAVFMKCGHGMCRACFNKLCTSCEERDVFLQCPSCGKRLSSNEVSSIPMIDRIISALTVKCENSKHGCSWTGQIAAMNAHVMICEYSLVLCPEEHCSEMIPKCMVQDHLANTCLRSKVQCIYHSFGCGMKIVRQTMDDHLYTYSAEHLQLASEKLLAKEKEIEALTKENEALKSELQQAKRNNQKMNDFQIQLRNANEERNKLSVDVKNSVSEIATLKENLKVAILMLEKVDQHLESEEIIIESRGISETEVIGSIKIAFLKKLGYGGITKTLVSLSRAEYLRLAKCLEIQVLAGISGLAKSLDAGVKFSSSYWDGFTVSLKDWLKEGILKQRQLIELYCRQLQYIHGHGVKTLKPLINSITVGDYYFMKFYCEPTDTASPLNIGSPCKNSSYQMSGNMLKLSLPKANEVYLCSFTTLECIMGEKITDNCYKFDVKDDFKQGHYVMLKN